MASMSLSRANSVMLFQVSTPDLLITSDLFGPLPRASPVPSQRFPSVHSSSSSSSSSSGGNGGSGSSLGTTNHSSSILESIHSFSDLLLRNSQETNDSPQQSPFISPRYKEAEQKHPSEAECQSSAEEDSIDLASSLCACDSASPDQSAPSDVSAQPYPAPADPVNADSSGAADQPTPVVSRAASGITTADPIDPIQQNTSVGVAQASVLTPDLLQTPAVRANAASSSQTTSGPLPFCETVMRGAAIVQNSLLQDSPSDALHSSEADHCLPSCPSNGLAEAHADGLGTAASLSGSESLQGGQQVKCLGGIVEEGSTAAGQMGPVTGKAAHTETQRKALKKLALRQSVSRSLSLRSQTSSDGAPPKLLRPSSSPAGVSPAAHKTGNVYLCYLSHGVRKKLYSQGHRRNRRCSGSSHIYRSVFCNAARRNSGHITREGMNCSLVEHSSLTKCSTDIHLLHRPDVK